MSGGSDPVRWEARSHEQIYDEVHRPDARSAACPLAATVPMYKEFSADLLEIRSRYESLVRRLVGGSAGAGADAAGLAAGLVFRGLTDAHGLMTRAGARRSRLSELNEYLRQQMPEPVGAPEITSGFVGQGRAWLAPPPFEAEDNARHGVRERARDLMREYGRATLALAGGDGDGPLPFAGPPVPPDQPLDGPTVQLASSWRDGPSPQHQVPQAVDGVRHWSAAQPMPPHAQPPWAVGGYAEFGPRGHLVDDQDTGGRAAGGALGTPPPPRDQDTVLPMPRRDEHDLFSFDVKTSKPVIGL